MRFSPLDKTMSITATVQFTASNVLWTRRKAIDSMPPQRPPPQCANNTSTGGGEAYISPSNTSLPLWKLQRKGKGRGRSARSVSSTSSRFPLGGMSNSKVFWRRGRMGRRKEEEDDEDPIFSFFFSPNEKVGFWREKGGS